MGDLFPIVFISALFKNEHVLIQFEIRKKHRFIFFLKLSKEIGAKGEKSRKSKANTGLT